MMVRVTAVLLKLEQVPLLYSAQKVTVPTDDSVGLPTVSKPVGAAYQVTPVAETNAALAFNV